VIERHLIRLCGRKALAVVFLSHSRLHQPRHSRDSGTRAQRLPPRNLHLTVIHRPIHRRVERPHLPSRLLLSRAPPAVHGLHLRELNSDISKF